MRIGFKSLLPIDGVIALIISSFLLTSCAWLDHRRKVLVLKAFDLRHVIEPGSNEHSIRLTLEIDPNDLRNIGDRSLMVQSVSCDNPELKPLYREPYGFDVRPRPDENVPNSIDFELLRTNVPAEIESTMNEVKSKGCAFLYGDKGYGFTEYYSEPFPIEFEKNKTSSPRT